jgi:hypothetical protein
MNRTKPSTTDTRLAERILDSNIAEFEQQGTELSQKIHRTVTNVTHLADRVKAPVRKLDEVKRNPEPYLVIANGALLFYMFVRWLRT